MSIFDEAYDQMSIQEVCYRLPGELAVRALQRRITDLITLLDFVKTVGSQPTFVQELKNHINNLLDNESVPNILAQFDQSTHRLLFGWLNDNNKNRIKNEGRSELDTKFLFNLSGEKDLEDLKFVLDRLLSQSTISQSAISSVLSKANSTIFPQLMDTIIKDPRPEVRECILCVNNSANLNLISDHQRTVALKAFVKSKQHLQAINIQSFKSFTALKPKERLDALGKYLNHFPPFRKLKVFDPEPSKEEFELILFAGCLEHNDLVLKISEKYKSITELDAPPADEVEENTI